MAIVRQRKKYTGKIPKISHEELVQRAFLYLQFSKRCSVVFKERRTSVSETPDAIGFRGGFSFLIECKASRADFLSDKKKWFRRRPEQGMGHERYFMAPIGLLEPEEIPDGWGLLEVYEIPPMCRNRTVKITKESKRFSESERYMSVEISYLVSAIRRLNISMAVFIESPGSCG